MRISAMMTLVGGMFFFLTNFIILKDSLLVISLYLYYIWMYCNQFVCACISSAFAFVNAQKNSAAYTKNVVPERQQRHIGLYVVVRHSLIYTDSCFFLLILMQ